VSLQATLRGARETLRWLAQLLENNATSCARLHYVWSMPMAAAVRDFTRDRKETTESIQMVYVTLIEKAPQCPQSKEARWHIENAIGLFAAGAQLGSERAKQSHVSIANIKLAFKTTTTYQGVLSTLLEQVTQMAGTISHGIVHSDRFAPLRPKSEPIQELDINQTSTTAYSSPLRNNISMDDVDLPASTPSLPRPSPQSLPRNASLSSITGQLAFSPKESPVATNMSFYPSFAKVFQRTQAPRHRPAQKELHGSTISASEFASVFAAPEVPLPGAPSPNSVSDLGPIDNAGKWPYSLHLGLG
jgi:hypothetical protein